MDAEELLKQALARGDEREAARIAIEAYGDEVLGYLMRVMHDEETGREVFALVSEQLVVGIGRYRADATIRAYLYGIAWNLALKQRRKLARRKRREAHLPTGSVLAAAASRTRTPLWQRTVARDRLEAIRAQMSPDELSLLVLRVDRRMSWDEVAAILGVSAATVRKRYERLVKKLRSWITAPGES